MNLKVKFELNKELDKRIADIFLSRDIKVGGIDFSKNVTNYHPELEEVKSKEEKIRKEKIIECFDRYYDKNKKELEKSVSKARGNWSKVENKFIKQINKIFKNPKLPDGKYIGYLSVVNCNPRFLDDKTFQFFYKHRSGSNMVTAHEILHFFFFDYAVEKHPDIFDELKQENGSTFWMLSEIFNDVILSLPEFVEIHGQKGFVSYPAHEKYLKYMKKLWTDNPNIDNWLIEGYNYLNNAQKEK